eukprot:m.754655 g.754655  ORF g.754655 m.754655 type:complete len:620 (-) comp59003_c0_seq3:2669-4528(-)
MSALIGRGGVLSVSAIGAGVVLGRGPATQLRTPTVSRHHFEISPRSDTTLLFKQLGNNASSVNGRAVEAGEVVILRDGDLVAFLATQPEVGYTVSIAKRSPEPDEISFDKLQSAEEQRSKPPQEIIQSPGPAQKFLPPSIQSVVQSLASAQPVGLPRNAEPADLASISLPALPPLKSSPKPVRKFPPLAPPAAYRSASTSPLSSPTARSPSKLKAATAATTFQRTSIPAHFALIGSKHVSPAPQHVPVEPSAAPAARNEIQDRGSVSAVTLSAPVAASPTEPQQMSTEQDQALPDQTTATSSTALNLANLRRTKDFGDSRSPLVESAVRVRTPDLPSVESDLVVMFESPAKLKSAEPAFMPLVPSTAADPLTEFASPVKRKRDPEPVVEQLAKRTAPPFAEAAQRDFLGSPSRPTPSATSHGGGLWRDALRDIIRNPARHRSEIILETPFAVVIKDKFPKARFHFLVLPKLMIDDIYALRQEHLPTLKAMQEAAALVIKSSLKESPRSEFKTGFHAKPSMAHLHMHAISQDFDSAAMNKKKHWNSFTTPFFVGSKGVYDRVKELGAYPRASGEKELDDLLQRDLRCHKCPTKFKTIPSLKEHLLQRHPFPGSAEPEPVP